MPSMVQRQTLRVVLGIVCLLQLAELVSGYAEAASNSQEQQAQAADHTAQLCIGGHQFHVPIIRQLDADPLEPALSHCLAGNECVLPEGPTRIGGIKFYQYRNAYGPPLLDAILGRQSAYRVSTLYLGTVPFEKVRAPFHRVSVSNVISFVPDNLKLMGESVKMTCIPSVSESSEYEKRFVCFGIGHALPKLGIQFMFAVGSDLEGQWAIEADAWDKRDWSAWQDPLAEVEAAVRSMIVDDEGQNACRLESDK